MGKKIKRYGLMIRAKSGSIVFRKTGKTIDEVVKELYNDGNSYNDMDKDVYMYFSDGKRRIMLVFRDVRDINAVLNGIE